MAEDLNIVAEYGKLHFKLRKLKQLDQQRIKLIQQVANEASEMGLGENARFIFDLPSNTTSTEKTSTFTDSLPESFDEELIETLKHLESMSTYLEKGINELFESGRISSRQFLEMASTIPEEALLSAYLQEQVSHGADAVMKKEESESKDSDDKDNSILSHQIHTSTIQNMLCQWDDKEFIDGSIGEFSHSRPHFVAMLAELRQRNEHILRKVVSACEPLCPFEIHLS